MSTENMGGVPPKSKNKATAQQLDDILKNMTSAPPKKKEAAEVIIIRETWLDSLISDAGTFLTVLALVGVGILLRSDVLQWVGAIMFMICIITWSVKGYDSRRMTIEEARARLDEIEKDMG